VTYAAWSGVFLGVIIERSLKRGTGMMYPTFIVNLDHLAFRGPYQIKLEVLELACQPIPCQKRDLSEQERIYQQFLMRHGHRLLKKTA
jgi:hypothetical protein